MLNSIILLGGLVSAFGLGAISPNQEKQDNVNFRLENHKSVSYNDESYTITLSADELNNYSFENVYNLIQDYSSTATFANFVYYDTNHNFQAQYYNGAYVVNISLKLDGNDNYQMLLNSDNDYKFIQRIFRNGNVISYVDFVDIEFEFSSSYYSAFKQAIELDIQANQPANYGNVLTDIVSLLTGGIVGLASGLGSGVSTLVGDIFLNAGHTGLSVFGYMVVIFAGIALAIGLSRWVMNFLTSLGAKK